MMQRIPHATEYWKSGGTAELYSQIEIHAISERGWEVLSDFQHYPYWNPFIQRIRSNLTDGERITADLRPKGGSGMTILPVLLRVIPGRELR